MTNTQEVQNLKENAIQNNEFDNQVLICPAVNIYEAENDFFIVADMPGVSKENLKINVANNLLTISGFVNNRENEGKYILRESLSGNYFRKFRISDGVDSEKIEANFENGQLSIKLPKHDRMKPRTIDIK
ncbi:MAG TPA: Hsp20/alpha crystallin family protein [Ignavibacteriaceae bacterium]|jgi:HSP20 family protein|nr:Hsp20/alpha crystallin family protein [Ignavibacteriaceae bacterium]